MGEPDRGALLLARFLQPLDLGLAQGELVVAYGDLGRQAIHQGIDLVHAVTTEGLIEAHLPDLLSGEIADGYLRQALQHAIRSCLGQTTGQAAGGEEDGTADDRDPHEKEDQAHGAMVA